MGAIKELVSSLGGLIVPLSEFTKPWDIHSSYWHGEVSENRWIFKVKDFRFVVLQDPRHNGVLGQILKASLSIRIEDHQILKISDLALTPLLSVNFDVLLCSNTLLGNNLMKRIVDLVSFVSVFKDEIH